MPKIDIEKNLCKMMGLFADLQKALKDQGLEYKDGKIVEINKCAECTNDKGCVTCGNGDQFETTKERGEMHINKELADRLDSIAEKLDKLIMIEQSKQTITTPYSYPKPLMPGDVWCNTHIEYKPEKEEEK